MVRLNTERLRTSLSGLSLKILQYLDVWKKDEAAKETEDRVKGKPRLCDNMEVKRKVF